MQVQLNINEEEIVRNLNVDHMRQNIRLQVESKLAGMIEAQIEGEVKAKVKSVLDSTDFTKKVEDLLLNAIQGSGQIIFRPNKHHR